MLLYDKLLTSLGNFPPLYMIITNLRYHIFLYCRTNNEQYQKRKSGCLMLPVVFLLLFYFTYQKERYYAADKISGSYIHLHHGAHLCVCHDFLQRRGLENGVTFATFGYALKHMWVEVIGAFIAQRYIAAPVVKKLVRRVFTPDEDKPVFIILATAGFTVAMMAPIMTLYVSIYHLGLRPSCSATAVKACTEFPVRAVRSGILCRAACKAHLQNTL